jgi:8-oxo-dGTP pyrophosphatase MutT (NUDIX family)
MTILGLPKREVYDRGNGSAILLYNTKQKNSSNSSVSFTNVPQRKQNRMMIEVCAGMLDQDNAEQCVIRETEEETPHNSSQDYGNLYVSGRRN